MPLIYYRITNIPLQWSRYDLTVGLEQLDPGLTKVHELSLYPSLFGRCQTALVANRQRSAIFDDPNARFFEVWVDSQDEPTVLEVDAHFRGLTPLNTPEGDVVADVVAVTGLAGHAYGSWCDRETSTRSMWLKDFLPRHIPSLRVRIMTYGYDSRLTGNTNRVAGVGMADYMRYFVEQLMSVRSATRGRPIIFIAHSLGGLLVSQALVQSNDDQHYADILKSTNAIFFFGTPHGGLRTQELERMSREQPGNPPAILSQLRPGSSYLVDLNRALLRILRGHNIKIFSFYERLLSPSVRRNSSGTYARDGSAVEMVTKEAAVLGIDGEIQIPVDRSHSDLVKFPTENDQDYQIVVGHLEDCLNVIIRNRSHDHNHPTVQPQINPQRPEELQNPWNTPGYPPDNPFSTESTPSISTLGTSASSPSPLPSGNITPPFTGLPAGYPAYPSPPVGSPYLSLLTAPPTLPMLPVHPQCRDVRVYDLALYNKEQTLRSTQPAVPRTDPNPLSLLWLNTVETPMRSGPLYMVSPMSCAMIPLPTTLPTMTIEGSAMYESLRKLPEFGLTMTPMDLTRVAKIRAVGFVHHSNGRHAEALRWFEWAFAAFHVVLGKQHHETILTIRLLSNCLCWMGYAPHAFGLYHWALWDIWPADQKVRVSGRPSYREGGVVRFLRALGQATQ